MCAQTGDGQTENLQRDGAHPHRPSAHPPVSTPARQLPAAFLSAAGTIVFVSMLHGGVNHDKTDARTRTPHAGAAVIVVIHQWHPLS